jgi:two-component system chemotaxis response regulator CheV
MNKTDTCVVLKVVVRYTGGIYFMDTNILLENGTNELEILEFTLGGNHYGINVAKVREILSYQPVTPVPNPHPCVEGIFMPRDTMITVIDLKASIGRPRDEVDGDGLFIITNFNKLDIAFHVDEVLGIHRVSWTEIIKPGATVNTGDNGVSTGVVKIEERLIVILDFEKIVSDINPETGLKMSDLEALGERERRLSPVMVAEDSPLLSKLITDCLKKSGYTDLNVNFNGQEAWDKLCEMRDNGTALQKVHCIITDIEMPLMDGHRLTKLVKEDEILKEIPVIIFSSLINEQIRIKGEQLGADAQLTKPEIGNLVDAVDKLVDEFERTHK